MSDIATQYSMQDALEEVSALMIRSLNSTSPVVQDLQERTRQNPGKQLRARLTLICASACGYQGKHDRLLASVVELLHTATLLHDDVIDHATLRRGQKTINQHWGNQNAILLGDLLYVKGFEQLVSLNQPRILHILTHSSYQMVEGEIRQLAERLNFSLKEATYLKIIEAKTAYLFSGAAQCAAILSTVPEAVEHALRDFGKHLGIAFQLIDDILDYQAAKHALGKAPYNDLIEGKLTLPIIHALHCGEQQHIECIHAAFNDPNETNTQLLMLTLQHLKSFDYVQQKAEQEIESARQKLKHLPSSLSIDAALNLTDYIMLRLNQA